MSALEEMRKEMPVAPAVKAGAWATLLPRLLTLLSSVRFGVTLLVLLIVLCVIGMLVMQQNVEGFEKYYLELAPSQQILYGILGFFDIYHAWYFNALLMVLSLNIVLASLDRFPKTWRIVKRRKLQAGRRWLESQSQHESLNIVAASRAALVEQVGKSFRHLKFKHIVTEKDSRVFVFAERGAWNRFGYLAVHVALLTIFLGGFLTVQFERTGQLPLEPGMSASEMTNLSFQPEGTKTMRVPLPFTVECLDIQQKLIRKDGSIQANNTIDWLTRIKIKDEYGERDALVHLNNPYDYRGYRFFQASFVSFGQARQITLHLTPESTGGTQEVIIRRNGAQALADGTHIEFVDFQPDFSLGSGGRAASVSEDYNNPAAILKVTTPAGEQKTVYAFAVAVPDGAPVGAPFGGYKYRLADFEKVPLRHVLQIQKDPGKWPFYLGGAMLIATLCAVFFFSHQRVWAMIEEREDGRYEILLGGHTNRNRLGFEDRFKKLTHAIKTFNLDSNKTSP